MTIELKVKHMDSDHVWIETYKIGSSYGTKHNKIYLKEGSDPEIWARGLIKNYNETLRPGETARELVSVMGF